ncbi:hypothetical protein [Herpetosiphon geysericola]|uniref:Uncharacterized protein n=1 Tax=Herpetosiphon geysericola TaxID=70996 RepID=A0A0P6XUH8_9CHLR|nr:hypothetical protein [Herpetosiphon geysericola]KPL80216.1 hypothetical protein SE18_24480 [Herpetosiphon geysericola]
MSREITCPNPECGQEFDPQIDRDSDECESWITAEPCPHCGHELDGDYLADLETTMIEDSIEIEADAPYPDDELPF